MADLSTTYMGLELKNPIIAGAGRLTGHLESMKKIEEAGAGCVQVISTLFANKISHIGTMLHDITDWMDAKGYASLDAFRGKMSKQECPDPWMYEREQYIKMLFHADEDLKQYQES